MYNIKHEETERDVLLNGISFKPNISNEKHDWHDLIGFGPDMIVFTGNLVKPETIMKIEITEINPKIGMIKGIIKNG